MEGGWQQNEKNRNEDKKVSHAISSRLKSQILIFEEGYSEVFRKRACKFIIFKPFLSPCTLLLDPACLSFLRGKSSLHFYSTLHPIQYTNHI